jgi:hypothetical protein
MIQIVLFYPNGYAKKFQHVGNGPLWEQEHLQQVFPAAGAQVDDYVPLFHDQESLQLLSIIPKRLLWLRKGCFLPFREQRGL